MIRSKTSYYDVKIPDTLQGFKEWEFSSGSTTGLDFKIFVRKFRSYIKKNIPVNSKLILKGNHYYISGFIEKNNRFVYFSISDVRYFPDSWKNDILIRTAESTQDFTGGINNSCNLENFKIKVENLLNQ
jgi:hypothetical protein